MTIYDVIKQFFESIFPSGVYLEYYEIFEIIQVFVSLYVVFGLILIPLWRLATYFLPKGKRK